MTPVLRALAVLCCSGAMAGCAVAPIVPPSVEGRPAREAIREFSFDGRISVTRAAERAQASVVWHHVRGERDEIDVFSPVGSQQLARLEASPAGATLETAEHRRLQAPDAEALSGQVFGSPLPLRGMPDWVLGRSAGQPVSEERDARGRYAYLAEAGWTIRYADYESDDAAALPRSMDFERGDLHVRLRVDTWNLVR